MNHLENNNLVLNNKIDEYNNRIQIIEDKNNELEKEIIQQIDKK